MILKLPKLKNKPLISLTEAELLQFENFTPEREVLEKTKTLFLFQAYTGASHYDAMHFNIADVKVYNGKQYWHSSRRKTGTEFITPLNAKALALLAAHNFKMPKQANYWYNLHLKEIAASLKIEKHITSHVARKTFGQLMLDRHCPIETVSKMMGHSNTLITEQCYARVGVTRVVKDLEMIYAAAA